MEQLKNIPEESSETADWKAVLNLKIAEHLTRTMEYRGAQ